MSLPAEKLDEFEKVLADLEAVEAKLRTLQDGLTRSHRLATLGTMASIIAHEFNNILTPVISYCQLAEAAPHDTQLMRKAIDRSLKGALKAAQISSSMLGFARDSDEAVEARVATVVDEVFNCLARAPEKDGIKLTLQIPTDLIVAMSPVNLQQVLLNLVLNARQALRGKRGSLTITAEKQGDRALLQIIDTGPGIPEAVRDRVFEPFVTQRDPHCPEGKGTGLGLAICRDLVKAAGGEIRVASTGPEGTTFAIDLPIARPSGK